MKNPNNMGLWEYIKAAHAQKTGLAQAYERQQAQKQAEAIRAQGLLQYKKALGNAQQGTMFEKRPDQRLPTVSRDFQEGAGVLGSIKDPTLLENAKFYGALGANPLFSEQGIKGLSGLLDSRVSKPQNPTSLMQNIEAAGFKPGTKPFMAEMIRAINKPATTINMGAINKPVGENAIKWRNDAGQQADPTKSGAELAAAGFTPRSTDELKTMDATKASGAPIAQMMQWGFEGDGLFPPDSEGLLSRVASGIEAYASGSTDSNEKQSLYRTNQQALVTSLARLVGQVGTLTDRDVDTVASLFPTPGFTPVSIAKSKFQSIAKLLTAKGVPKEQLVELGFPDWVFSDKEVPAVKTIKFGDLK